MILLALLLILIAAGLTATALLADGGTVSIDVLGQSYSAPGIGLFLLGVVATVALLLGLWLIKAGMSRARRRRAEGRQREAQEREDHARVAQEREQLAAENARMERQLNERPSGRSPPDAPRGGDQRAADQGGSADRRGPADQPGHDVVDPPARESVRTEDTQPMPAQPPPDRPPGGSHRA
jgi:membrane protein implicated in regulation of membrane protease activity